MSSRYFDFRLALGIPVLLMALLLAFDPSPVDFALARLFYEPGQGFIGRSSFWLEDILHDRAKQALMLEVHLFDTAPDLYGEHLRVALVEHLRPERKFSGLEELRRQIADDSTAARRILAELPVQAGVAAEVPWSAPPPAGTPT